MESAGRMEVERHNNVRCLLLGHIARSKDLAGKARIVVFDDSADTWDVEFRYPATSMLGVQLANFRKQTSSSDVLLMKIIFPKTFPSSPPIFRLVQPRLAFTSTNEILVTDGGILRLAKLSSAAWQPWRSGQETFERHFIDLLLDVHEGLSTASIDFSTRPYFLPSTPAVNFGSTSRFETIAPVSQFPAVNLEQAIQILPELTEVQAGCVLLPHQCAMEVYSRVFGETAQPSAMHVEIKNCATEERVYAGMSETTAVQDSAVFLPAWMMRQLFLNDGDEVRIRAVTLPMCTCVHLQPQSQDFYEMAGPDPLLLLQESLAPLPALTAGFSIPLGMAQAGAADWAIRKFAILVARLEDASGDVQAAKLPGHSGILGDCEVRLELLPAPDLPESGHEYKERLQQEAERRDKVEHMLAAKRAQSRQETKRKTGKLDLGDETEGFELCLKFPNGAQLRRRFTPELSIGNLKRYILSLVESDAECLWKPNLRQTLQLELARMFPRHAFLDDETIMAVGDKSVVLVMEKAFGERRDSEYVVLCPPEVENAFGNFGTCDTYTAEMSSFPTIPSPPPEQLQSRSPDIGLMALPESELRELAVSLGLSHLSCLSSEQSKSQLVELITQQQLQQHRAVTRLKALDSRRQAMPGTRSLCSLSTAVAPRAASLSAQRPGRRRETERSQRSSQSLGAERSERVGSGGSHPTAAVISPTSSSVQMQPQSPTKARNSAPGRPPRGKAAVPLQRPSGRAMTTSPRSNLEVLQSVQTPHASSGISDGGHQAPAAPRALSERRQRTEPRTEPRRPIANSSTSSASSASPSRPGLGVGARSALRGIGQMVVEERSMERRAKVWIGGGLAHLSTFDAPSSGSSKQKPQLMRIERMEDLSIIELEMGEVM